MTRRFGGKTSHIPGLILFLALWILSLSILAPTFLEFRRAGYLDLGSGRLEGVEAVAGIAILGLIPVTMLALAIQRIYRFSRDNARERGPGE